MLTSEELLQDVGNNPMTINYESIIMYCVYYISVFPSIPVKHFSIFIAKCICFVSKYHTKHMLEITMMY